MQFIENFRYGLKIHIFERLRPIIIGKPRLRVHINLDSMELALIKSILLVLNSVSKFSKKYLMKTFGQRTSLMSFGMFAIFHSGSLKYPEINTYLDTSVWTDGQSYGKI